MYLKNGPTFILILEQELWWNYKSRVTHKTDNPLKVIHKLVNQKSDNSLKGTLNLLRYETSNQLPRVLSVST